MNDQIHSLISMMVVMKDWGLRSEFGGSEDEVVKDQNSPVDLVHNIVVQKDVLDC